MSIDMNFTPGVETVLLKSNFTVSRLAVGVPQSMSTSRLFPQYVSRVLLTSALWGRSLQTILVGATSFHPSPGISHLLIKNMVFVPSFLPGIP